MPRPAGVGRERAPRHPVGRRRPRSARAVRLRRTPGQRTGQSRDARSVRMPARPSSSSAPTSRSPARRPSRSSRGSSAPDRGRGRRPTGRSRACSSPLDPRDVEARGERHDRPAGRPRTDLADRGRGRPVPGRRGDRRRDRRLSAVRGGRDPAVVPARPAGQRRVADHRSARRRGDRPRRLHERVPPVLAHVLRPDMAVPRSGRALVPHDERRDADHRRPRQRGAERLARGLGAQRLPRERVAGPPVGASRVGDRAGRAQR